jgi:release factor glutamine methyltransferase
VPSVLEVLREGSDRLSASGIPNADWDAERLLRHVLSWDRAAFLAHAHDAIDPGRLERFRTLITERARRIPLQHIVGRQAFWRLELVVTPDVLIPRPETEILVETALAHLTSEREPVVVDVGTGSGNIVLAIAHERPDALLHATDLSGAALDVARQNAARLGLGGRVRFHQGDLLAPVDHLRGTVHLVASNPPYVSLDEAPSLAPEVTHHEPAVALFAPDGPCSVYRRLASAAHHALSAGGWLVVEVGAGMAAPVSALLREAGFAVEIPVKDLMGVDRVVAARRPSS